MIRWVRLDCLSEEGTIADVVLAKPDCSCSWWQNRCPHCFIEILSSESRISFGLELFRQPDGVSEIPLCCMVGAWCIPDQPWYQRRANLLDTMMIMFVKANAQTWLELEREGDEFEGG